MRSLFFTIIIFSLLSADEGKLPVLKLKDLNNKRLDLSSLYADGPVAINAWNMSCEPCKKEMKYLNDFHIKYEDQGFKFVSVNIDSPRSMSKVKSYLKSMKWDFPILSDPRAEFFRKTGGKVMPYLLLVNRDGTIFKRHVGFNPGEEVALEAEIVEMLALNFPERTKATEDTTKVLKTTIKLEKSE
ncbi:MAG: TlpA family protein disulfide reductase [Candidatus Marinimicrobia bacterium]|jgi:cytochrome c biogenesis protein CcmG, thiol:disulfide interchange protein DsbE|nr:TlpA family protein disulfide reductase [Candidatus Neomarinimicrobiota bacterium]MBT7378019.1 TlpA family protein disulfide reductase [Candidatus Neomarinimicrobiota bacterium]